MFIAYLDEFGHIGPFVHRSHDAHKTSPVFGLGGIVLPFDQVRHFATYFFQLKCRLLDFEIKRSGAHPAKWEKKGSALYTTENVTKYQELRKATNRLLNHLSKIGGFVFFVGLEKTFAPEQHRPKVLYRAVLMEAIRRLDGICGARNCKFMIVLDEQEGEFRKEVVEASGRTMFGTDSRRHLIEPPIQAESHLYQTLQCADWICGLVGRYGAYITRTNQYQDLDWVERYFSVRLRRAAVDSSIRKAPIVIATS